MTYRQEAESVLARWRAVERLLSEAEPGSADAAALQAQALRLRDRYQALVDEVERAHGDDHPPTSLLSDVTGSA
jgi:hypothetical protein